MRLLADEYCSKPVVDALRASGHDVRHVLEFDPGAADRTVAATAVSEDRVIVTEDYDFGELAVRERLPMPGVVILYFSGEEIDIQSARVVEVVSRQGEGSLTTADRLRRRDPVPRRERPPDYSAATATRPAIMPSRRPRIISSAPLTILWISSAQEGTS